MGRPGKCSYWTFVLLVISAAFPCSSLWAEEKTDESFSIDTTALDPEAAAQEVFRQLEAAGYIGPES